LKQQTSLFLDPQMHENLKELSAVTMAPVGALIRAAIADYLEKRKDELTPKKAVKK
jgi:predicted DNA-binding protein